MAPPPPRPFCSRTDGGLPLRRAARPRQTDETWTVHKRYSEFHDLQKTLLELDPRVEALQFPKKAY